MDGFREINLRQYFYISATKEETGQNKESLNKSPTGENSFFVSKNEPGVPPPHTHSYRHTPGEVSHPPPLYCPRHTPPCPAHSCYPPPPPLHFHPQSCRCQATKISCPSPRTVRQEHENFLLAFQSWNFEVFHEKQHRRKFH